MGANSKIEWTDHTFNPWIGCTRIAAGCAHCYAEALAKRTGLAQWGPQGTRTKTSQAYWRQPSKWNRAASFRSELGAEIEQNTGSRPESYSDRRPKVFCASLADVFEDWNGPMLSPQGRRLWTPRHGYVFDEPIPETGGRDLAGHRPFSMIDARENLFHLIDSTPHLDWLLLTKRPENIRRMWPTKHAAGSNGKFRSNVWLGTSVATQEDADANLLDLLHCRDLAPVLFVSAEPLLGPIDLTGWLEDQDFDPDDQDDIDERELCGEPRLLDWVIVGGESGPGARPMAPDWAYSLRDQCQAAGVPFFMKQMTKKRPIPDDLFVREFPDVAN